MPSSDWRSIEEIACLWGEETGQDPSSLKSELEKWFAQFVEQSEVSDKGGPETKTTNQLMGFLGSRYIEKRVFEEYCERRGLAKPRFWFVETSPIGETIQSEPSQGLNEAKPANLPGEEFDHQTSETDSRRGALWGSEERKVRPPVTPLFHQKVPLRHELSESEREQRTAAQERKQKVSTNGMQGERWNALDLKTQPQSQKKTETTRKSLTTSGNSSEVSAADFTAVTQQSESKDPAEPKEGLQGYGAPEASRQRDFAVHGRQQRRRLSIRVGLALILVALAILGGIVFFLQYGDFIRGKLVGGILDLKFLNEDQVSVESTPPLPREPKLMTPDASANTTKIWEQKLTAAEQQIAHLTAEVEESKVTIERLHKELAAARQWSQGTSTQTVYKEDKRLARYRVLAEFVSAAHVAMLNRTAESAGQKVKKSPKSAAGKRNVGSLEQESDTEARQSPTNLLAASEASGQGTGTFLSEHLRTSTDDVSSSLERVLLAASDYVGEEVVVIGEIVRVMDRYWIRSENDYRSILLDVDNLPLNDQEILAQISAYSNGLVRITGTVRQRVSTEYFISVTKLSIVD